MVVRAFDPIFEAAYQRWLESHIQASTGERKRRLKNGLGYSEKLFAASVWWVAFGSLDDLFPEYEVRDFKDGTRFLDFAFILGGLCICIEIDAYSTHCRDLDRDEFSDHLERQNDLTIDDWKVLRFSLDKIKTNPRHCQLKLQQALGKWGLEKAPSGLHDPVDLAIHKLMTARNTPLSPIEIARELGWDNGTVAKHLRRLAVNEYVLPVTTAKKRVRKYVANRKFLRRVGSK